MYDARLGRFMAVDPLASKYPYLSTFQFASNSPIFQIDVDGAEGEDYMKGLLNEATSKLKNYIAKKSIDFISSAMGTFANYFNEHIEVKFYAKVEMKYTLGARYSNELIKKGGLLLTGDVNLSSVEIGSLSGEVDLKTGEFKGNINYLNKDGKIVFSQGVSGSLAAPIFGPLTAGVGAGGNATQTKKDGKNVNETKSGNTGAAVGLGNITGTVDQEKDFETSQKKTSGTVSAGLNGSFGAGAVIEYNAEVGVKTTIKEEIKDE